MGMQLIETVEVGAGGAASIEFTGIPQDGVDLVLLTSLRVDRAFEASFLYATINNDSGANYSYIGLRGYNSSASSDSASSNTLLNFNSIVPGNLATANTFGNHQMYFSNYAGTSPKSISMDAVSETNSALAGQRIEAMLWNQTTAITSIELKALGGDYVLGSTASLYKITAD